MQKHRLDIDGLRTFAIAPVILFHMGFSFVPGGFLGVDVFFVISGFLITGILANEMEATGKISLLKFYERRIRRIMPGFILVLAVTFVASWFVLFPNEFNALKQSMVFSLASLSNFYFLGAVNYFSPNTDALPLLHTWSLSVEEQFYVVFPLVLFLGFRFFAKRFRAVLFGSILIASLIYAQINLQNSPDETFYLIQFRAWEFLAGSLAVLYLMQINVRTLFRNGLSGLGLVTIVFSYIFLGGEVQHPGLATLAPILGTVLVLSFSRPQTLTYRVLATRPLVFVGALSYSLYLWHQPVFALVRSSNEGDASPYDLMPWLILVFVLSYGGWRFVENVFRNRGTMSTKSTLRFVGLGASAILLAGIFVQVPATSFAKYSVGDAHSVTLAQLEARLSPNYGVNRVCKSFLKHQTACTSGSGSGRPTVALWGDSFSMHIVQALQKSPTQAKFIAQTLITCNPISGMAPRNKANGIAGATNCNRTNSAFFNYLLSSKAKSSIRTVILASHWENIILDGKTTLDTSGKLSKDSNKPRQALQVTIDKLKRAGYRVVVISSPAYVSSDTGACLKNAVVRKKNLANCNFSISANRSTGPNALLKSLVTKADKYIDLAALMCPQGTCRASAGSILIYRDKYHISREGSAYLGRQHDLMGLALR